MSRSEPSSYAASRAHQAVIVVFAKPPRPGLVKTRMSPPLTPDEAADLYDHMLGDVLAATASFAVSLDLGAVIAVHPSDACREIAQRAPSCFRVIAQRGRDLAERMTWAVAEAAAEGANRIFLRSSDSLVLSRDIIEEGLSALEDAHVAISPDLDGGYSLIGLRGPLPGLWDHPMSTRSVLEDTLDNVKRLGLRAQLLTPSPDLDTADDLVELARRREGGATGLCPLTMGFLDENAFWPESEEA